MKNECDLSVVWLRSKNETHVWISGSSSTKTYRLRIWTKSTLIDILNVSIYSFREYKLSLIVFYILIILNYRNSSFKTRVLT